MSRKVHVEKTVTINKPAAELYHFWRDFENLPCFMKHLKSVNVINNHQSHWIEDAPFGTSVEWDAEIINEQENQLIAWASMAGSDIKHSGSVQFQPATGERGTAVKVKLEYESPAGIIGDAIAKLFGKEPEQQIGDDLYRFKQLMETGEIATTEGQSSGR